MKLQNIHQHSGVSYKGCYITFFPQISLVDNFNLNALISMNVSTFFKNMTFCMFVNNDTMIYCDK